MIKNEIVEVGQHKWLIREAVSKEAAEDAIALAMTTGSVSVTCRESSLNQSSNIKAVVVRLDKDGNEVQPN